MNKEEFERRIAELEEALEHERLRLAGCGVAAMQNTEESRKDRIDIDHHCYSASYGDVCRAVDREIKLRAERDEARALVEKCATEPWFRDHMIAIECADAVKRWEEAK